MLERVGSRDPDQLITDLCNQVQTPINIRVVGDRSTDHPRGLHGRIAVHLEQLPWTIGRVIGIGVQGQRGGGYAGECCEPSSHPKAARETSRLGRPCRGCLGFLCQVIHGSITQNGAGGGREGGEQSSSALPTVHDPKPRAVAHSFSDSGLSRHDPRAVLRRGDPSQRRKKKAPPVPESTGGAFARRPLGPSGYAPPIGTSTPRSSAQRMASS